MKNYAYQFFMILNRDMNKKNVGLTSILETRQVSLALWWNNLKFIYENV